MAVPMRISMLDLKREYDFMKERIEPAIARCLEHQKWILGPEVKEFEEAMAQYLGVKYCIGVSSGTEALVVALRSCAIKLKGREYFDRTDEIITTPFTFTATGDAILRAGATPVFVDIDPLTYNIDPGQIDKYVSQYSAVVGILPVHLYGRPCDMDRIMTTAESNNLFVLEDVAQAFGGSWKGRSLGTIGTAGAFSFFPSKNLGAFGDGGMICTNDDGVAELARILTKHGGQDKYDVMHVGYNARLDTFQAAILLAKLGFVNGFNEGRRRVAADYTKGLQGQPGITLPAGSVEDGESPCLPDGHVFHQYTVRMESGKRDAVQKTLQDNGVGTMVYYPVPLHKMKVFGDGRSVCGGTLGNAEKACSTVLSLPIEPLQTEEETRQVVKALKEAL